MAGPTLARDVMTVKLIVLRPEMDVFEAIDILSSHRISGAPVVDQDGRFLGVFSEKCSMGALLDAIYGQLPSRELRQYYDPAPLTVVEETELLTLAQIFQSTSHRRLPVLRDGVLVGQISRSDVMRSAIGMLRPSAASDSGVLYQSAAQAGGGPIWS